MVVIVVVIVVVVFVVIFVVASVVSVGFFSDVVEVVVIWLNR